MGPVGRRRTAGPMRPELVPPAVAQQRLDAQTAALPADTRLAPSTISYVALLTGPRHASSTAAYDDSLLNASNPEPSTIAYDTLLRSAPAT